MSLVRRRGCSGSLGSAPLDMPSGKNGHRLWSVWYRSACIYMFNASNAPEGCQRGTHTNGTASCFCTHIFCTHSHYHDTHTHTHTHPRESAMSNLILSVSTPEIDKIRLLGFTTLHDARRDAIPILSTPRASLPPPCWRLPLERVGGSDTCDRCNAAKTSFCGSFGGAPHYRRPAVAIIAAHDLR